MTSLEAALAFAQKIGFPSYGIVAMPDSQPRQSLIFKGITREAQLTEVVTGLLKKFGQAHLETDMRAMYNPMRMNVIAQATRDLVGKCSQCCPQCNCPGFIPVNAKLDYSVPCVDCQPI